jgi:hypothetical protein
MSSLKQRRKVRRRAEKLMDEAFAAVQTENTTLAERLSRRAIDGGRVNPRLWLDHGRILEACGRSDEAGEAVRQAITLAPRYADAFAVLARMQACQGKLIQAERLQRRAVELDETDVAARETLAAYAALLPPIDGDPGAAAAARATVRTDYTERTERYDWDAIDTELRDRGMARIPDLISEDECDSMIALWDEERFEHEVTRDDPDEGRFSYRFFARPLPELVAELRAEFYGRLARIGNGWYETLGRSDRLPESLPDFIARCHDAGQARTTPILLSYEPGGFNAPHRDIAGRVVFPFQLAVTLGPGCTAADGGSEFRLVDVRPGKIVHDRRLGTGRGDGIVFCTRDRLVQIAGVVGLQPVSHGLTEVVARPRFALGIPFHEHG